MTLYHVFCLISYRKGSDGSKIIDESVTESEVGKFGNMYVFLLTIQSYGMLFI